jgi:hypothetical protein
LIAVCAFLSYLLGLAAWVGVLLIPTMQEWISRIIQTANGNENTMMIMIVLMLMEPPLLLESLQLAGTEILL